MGLTLREVVDAADSKTGSRAATARRVSMSRQRLSGAVVGGPRMRAERLVSLALLTGYDAADVLEAGGHGVLARLLQQASNPLLNDLTPAKRRLLRSFDELPVGLQDVVIALVEKLRAEVTEATSPAGHGGG